MGCSATAHEFSCTCNVVFPGLLKTTVFMFVSYYISPVIHLLMQYFLTIHGGGNPQGVDEECWGVFNLKFSFHDRARNLLARSLLPEPWTKGVTQGYLQYPIVRGLSQCRMQTDLQPLLAWCREWKRRLKRFWCYFPSLLSSSCSYIDASSVNTTTAIVTAFHLKKLLRVYH